MADAEVPEDVEIRMTSREPTWDPTLGIPVDTAWQGTPRHRLVSIGDSLTHGVMSGAVFQTDLSYSAIIAHELGWEGLRFPRYDGPGGLPLNIELLMRDLEGRFGADVNWWELPAALLHSRGFMDRIEDYWERGPGATLPDSTATNHVLGVYGWTLRDVLVRTADSAAAEITPPKDNLLHQIVQNHHARAALRVLPRATEADRQRTALDAAASLGEETASLGEKTGSLGDGTGGSGEAAASMSGNGTGNDPEYGIETLVMFIGANNALGAATQLRVIWSGPGFDDVERMRDYTVWRPSHFAVELQRIATKVQQIRARHVIWCTVPHITIPPVTHGVGGKVRPGSRYFRFYTRPWISDDDFDPGRDPAITAEQARTVDSAIDQYNDVIASVVADARRAGRDWYLLDITGVLDRLAMRRYFEDPQARPDWWEPYPLPPELAALDPVPDTRFLTADEHGRRTGGLFSLDGVHPTTVGYGILAQEIIDVMVRAGVRFPAHPGPARVDFTRLIRRDTLLTRPPANVAAGLRILAWADQTIDLFHRIF